MDIKSLQAASLSMNNTRNFHEPVNKNNQVSDSSESIIFSNNHSGEEIEVLGRLYDVQAITEGELAELSKRLKDIGAISSDTYAVMSFPRRKSRAAEGADIDVNGKFDFLATSMKTLEYLKSSSAPQYTLNIQKEIVDILSLMNRMN
ncbi:hypothetical protein QTP81_11120 [Alteromonas sp. ASW11-36]|uniref:Uncharacterized protein n=1 Tax=Alteromonas arenosi TaxID=3055817 RepID=A0ABT7T036_9ALTE|nr:hypothetical protein [Alteromonas sp. ASW11-36]MDM7861149.1 hypothetical protein [Alteromonas sp. ASW11-36]